MIQNRIQQTEIAADLHNITLNTSCIFIQCLEDFDDYKHERSVKFKKKRWKSKTFGPSLVQYLENLSHLIG